ncbi:MAG: polysaccharide biosynthesis/export family protein [Verrucomicrobiota bacterium]|nr:polysaccharide biosynthesis/export family protein [Verrucomicrobiota bacterium]
MRLPILYTIFIVYCFLPVNGQETSGSDATSSTILSGTPQSSLGISSGVGISVGQNYILKPSDVLEVNVYQEPDLQKQVRIEADGTVALALIGKVRVAGMTVAESQALVTDLYNRDYLVDPQISVLVVSFAPKFVHVLGMVGMPGKIMIEPDQNLSLIDAIAQCRGVTRLGNPKKVRIKRKDGSKPFDVNYDEIRRGDATDIFLKEGDTITVPERVI